jgi:hypothetical protein
MQLPAKQALACFVVITTVLIAALFLTLGRPASPDAAGEAIGALIARTGFSALIIWYVAKKKQPGWSWLRFTSMYVLCLIIVCLVSAKQSVTAAEADPFPFEYKYSSDWSVQRLEGASSSPLDKDKGVHEIAKRTDAAGTGVAAMLQCQWLHGEELVDLKAELEKNSQSVLKSYLDLGYQAKMGKPVASRIGGKAGLAMEIQVAKDGAPLMVQFLGMVQSQRCMFSEIVAASQGKSALAKSQFDAIRNGLAFL